MKNLVLMFVLFCSTISFSQIVVDSVDLSQFWYDSSVVDNQIWQIGQTDKAFFDNEWVLVTDTTNMYDSLIDASIQMLITRPNVTYGYVIDFQHKIDADAINAGGYFEINFDNDTMYYDYNGTTYATWWLKFKNNPENNSYWDDGSNDYFEMITDSGHVMTLTNLSPIFQGWAESIINIEGYSDTLFNSCTGYTGQYQDWKQVHIELDFAVFVKTQDLNDTLNFKFHFVSDSTSNGKNGWAIKNIQTGYVLPTGSVDELTINNNQITSFPNPTENSTTVNLQNPENKIVRLNVYSVEGKFIATVYKQGSKFDVDVSKYEKGIYIIQYFIDNKNIGYSRVVKD